MTIGELLTVINSKNNLVYLINGIFKTKAIIENKYKDYSCKQLYVTTRTNSLTTNDISMEIITNQYTIPEKYQPSLEVILPEDSHYISLVLNFIIEEE